MYNDILDESWWIQKKKQEGERKGLREGILSITQDRFPAAGPQVQQKVDSIQDLQVLLRLLVKLSSACSVNEAISVLNEIQANG